MKRKSFYCACALLAAALVAACFWKPAPAPAVSSAVNQVQPGFATAPPASAPSKTEASPAGQPPGATTPAQPTPTQPGGEVQMNPRSMDAALEKRLALMTRLRDWAAKDLDGALAWCLNLPAGDERNQALQALCFALAQSDPAHAVEMAQTLQQPEDVLENLVQQWAASDVASVLAWANNQPAGDQRDQLMQRVSYVLAQTDPADAAGLVAEQIPPGPAHDEAVMTVVHQWGNQNLPAAAAWVQTFPDGALKARATEELEGLVQYRNELARQ